MRRDGPLDPGTTLEIASQVAAALVAAADRGLIHRDLKPSNLMLTNGGGPAAKLEVKVIDFGLAKAAATAGETDLTRASRSPTACWRKWNVTSSKKAGIAPISP